MGSFPWREYVRPIGQVGATEKVIGVFLLLLTAGIVGAFVRQAATDRNYLFTVDDALYAEAETAADGEGDAASTSNAHEPGSPFPVVGLPTWRKPVRTFRYSPENLHTKINGRAPLYIEAGIVSLTFGTYVHETNARRTVDVYWYDMSAPASAQALYQSEAPSEATRVPIGDEGYQIGGAVFFTKGAAYVQVLPSAPDEISAAAARSIAESIATAIEGDRLDNHGGGRERG